MRAVDVATGASEVVAEMIVPGPDQLLSLVDGPIARIPGVTGIHTAVVLRLLLTATDWDPYGDEPTATRRRIAEGGSLPRRRPSTNSTGAWWPSWNATPAPP
ncbi:hypothetical protein O1L55_27850 [Streptomyces albulus]|nr:hypothetical protein [Streptomyces noursei]